MNRTVFEHVGIALLIQLLVALATGNWWLGACLGAGVFIGREHAQAEYRWIAAFGNGRRANMPWAGGFDPRVWNHLDAWLDWLAPAVAVAGVAIMKGLN